MTKAVADPEEFPWFPRNPSLYLPYTKIMFKLSFVAPQVYSGNDGQWQL